MKQINSNIPTTIKDFCASGELFELEYDPNDCVLKTTPIPKQLDQYYPQEEYISYQNSTKGFVNFIYQAIKVYAASTKIKLVYSLVSNTKNVLDYGAGNGFLVQQLNKQNFNAFGVEPNPYARNQAAKNSIALFSSLEELPTLNFSVICLWHVLEHIPNYKEILKQLYSRLEDNGHLIIALPNYKSWDAQHYNSFWAAYDVPRHLYHFSKESIERLAHDFGFELIKTKPMCFDAYYVSYLSEKHKGATVPFIKGICNGLLSNIAGTISKEYSSHIYLLKKSKNQK